MSGLNPDGLGVNRTYGNVESDSVNTDHLSNKSAGLSYVVEYNGGDYRANPQVQGYAEFSNTNIRDLLESVFNEMRPAGTLKTAIGKILIKSPENDNSYSGTGSNLPLPGSVVLEGENVNHNLEQSTAAVRPPEPGVRIKSDGWGFVPPNVDSQLVPFPTVRNIAFEGAGHTVGIGFDGTQNSNVWDWLEMEKVTVSHVNDPYKQVTSGKDKPARIMWCNFENFDGQCQFRRHESIINTWFSVRNGVVTFNNAYVFHSHLHSQDGNPGFNAFGATRIRDCWVANVGTDGEGRGVSLNDESQLLGCVFASTQADWAVPIKVQPNANGAVIRGTEDETTSGLSVNVLSGASEVVIDDEQLLANGINDGGSATKIDGIIGGGGVGGVDIGSVTGASEGDVARADGTTAATPDTLWLLKSGGDWQRVDGGGTITPS